MLIFGIFLRFTTETTPDDPYFADKLRRGGDIIRRVSAVRYEICFVACFTVTVHHVDDVVDRAERCSCPDADCTSVHG